SLALSSPLPDPAELLSIPSPSSPLSRRRILPASPSYSSRRPHSLQIQSKSPSSIAPFLPSLYTNLAAGPPLVLPAPERATHRVHRDCRGPAVRELEDGGGGQQPGAVGRRAAGLRAARARIPHWPRLPLRPRPRRGEASAYARAAAATGAWVFDVDETLLSNLPYYAQHGYGLELFDHREFDRWLETGEAPVIPSSLRLYREVRDLGFKTFLLTGRSEAHEGRKSCRGPAMYAITKAFCVAFVMTFFSVFAAVPVGGAAATFGGATAAAPKGNLHQTLPHNSASKTSLTRLTCRTTRLSSLRTSLSCIAQGART
uniref:Acid phosphatase n=2 Tax=Aegilops tauschii subsp. strangulata TaxID=200361 RepID=A0A453BAW8_AEGTS